MSSPTGVPPFTLNRLRRPDGRTLAVLEEYDREAFGPAGLRTYDLAVMAEAGAVYVATSEDEIIGACQLMRVLDEPTFGYVVGFYVRPEWQGRGLGRRLLEAVAHECHETRIDGLLLTVAPENSRAMSLYASAGFVEEAFVPHFYGEGEDRYVLRWRFERGGLCGSV
jgi:ribosomal protein S18 acetylase RimI-like enzyme